MNGAPWGGVGVSGVLLIFCLFLDVIDIESLYIFKVYTL